MELVGLVTAGVAALALGAWRLYAATDAGRLRRAEATRVGDFPDREVGKIVGRVRYEGEPLVALLSRRPCIYYQAARLSDSEAPGEHKVITRGQDFIVEDDSGRALVRWGHVRVRIGCEQRGPPRVDPAELSDVELAEVEELCRAKSGGRALGEGYLFEEGVICEGDEVSVLGYGSWEPDPDPGAAATTGYRDTATRLVMESQREVELIVAVQ